MDPSRGREEFNKHNVKGCSTHMLVLRAIFGTANRKFVEQSPGQNVHLYNSEGSAKMVKIKNKKNKETRKRKPRKSQLESNWMFRRQMPRVLASFESRQE